MSSILELPPRWVVRATDPLAEQKLVNELGIPALLARLISQRGYTDPAVAEQFLHPKLDQLHPPQLLPDFQAACDAILAARDRKDLIFVHGDYDVDGISSAALFDRFLSTIGCLVHTHVPHRMKEGYGIHLSAVDAAIAMDAKLFLTCDCGSSALDQIDRAREAGMTVVVTDHHEIGAVWPKAHAFVNPHRPDSKYPFDSLSGVGVAYKLAMGIAQALNFPIDAFHRAFLDLVVLGTVADVMPLVDENRILTRHGLAALPISKRKGIQALMKIAEIKIQEGRPLTSFDIGFRLGPRLNATGRIDDAAKSLELLLEKDEVKAASLATELDEINKTRKEEQRRISDEASAMVEELGLDKHYVIIVGHENWHSGIVGIVAGKLVEQYRRPAFVLKKDVENGIYKGSARSIEAFHLKEAIDELSDVLRGGGHARAAGCSFPIERLDEVRERMHAYASGFLTPEDFVPRVELDLEVEPGDVTMSSVESLQLLEPCGEANPGPAFVARGLKLSQASAMGKDKTHARMSLVKPGHPTAKAVAFHRAEEVLAIPEGTVLDVAFRAEINEWQGNRNVQWQISGIRPTAPLEELSH